VECVAGRLLTAIAPLTKADKVPRHYGEVGGPADRDDIARDTEVATMPRPVAASRDLPS
jgi:hypothetical protein